MNKNTLKQVWNNLCSECPKSNIQLHLSFFPMAVHKISTTEGSREYWISISNGENNKLIFDSEEKRHELNEEEYFWLEYWFVKVLTELNKLNKPKE